MIRAASHVPFVSRAFALALVAACSPAKHNAPLLPDCDAGVLCGVTSGTGTAGTGGPGPDGGAMACGVIMYRDQTCNACVQAQCCARDVTCSANPDCLLLLRCVNTCPANDATCVRACRDKYQNAIADYDNFVTCAAASCSSECAGTDGGAACGVITFRSTTCDTCMSASCCSENRTCSDNPDCFALVQCAFACPATDMVCISDCQAQHPNGAPEYRALAQCVQTSCPTQCP